MELKNSRFGKDLTENPEVVSRNQLNTSKAKMQYSFAQSDRFSHAQKMYNIHNLGHALPINFMTSLIYGKQKKKVRHSDTAKKWTYLKGVSILLLLDATN